MLSEFKTVSFGSKTFSYGTIVVTGRLRLNTDPTSFLKMFFVTINKAFTSNGAK